MNQRKIRNYLINPKFQLQYVFWITLWGLVLTAINSFVFYYYISENYEIFIELNDITSEAKTLLYSELNTIIINLILISLGFLSIVSVSGIILSHKVAGPLYKFKKVFKAIKEGNKSQRVTLRPKDQFKDVAEEFNAMMDKI